MLQCASHPRRVVVEQTVDFFLHLNTVPTSSRHPQLQQPLYISLLDALLSGGATSLPVDFSSWAEADSAGDDEEAFARFREQCLVDVLDTCYTQLREQYLQQVGAALAAAVRYERSWGWG
jgi:hypothetical protein